MCMNTDIMIDLETLNTTPDASILTIGAVKFDPFGRELKEPAMDSFYVKVDLDSCDRIGLTTNDDTIAWWASQSKEAQDAAFDPEGRIDIEEAFAQLYKFCWGAKRVWSNGIVVLTLLFVNTYFVKSTELFRGSFGKCVMCVQHLI